MAAAIAAGLVLVVSGGFWLANQSADIEDRDKPQLGLMTSLPIVWAESADLGNLIANDAAAHWVKTALETRYEIVPIDYLAASDDAQPSAQLKSLRQIALMQPRVLSPAEFAALDAWVEGGGKLLLFADPLLTAHSDFALGDKRRPQEIALLSPILSRWGLVQFLDESQAAGIREIAWQGLNVPVEQAGHFEIVTQGDQRCTLQAQGLIAECQLGKGRALIVADAGMLDAESDGNDSRDALRALAQRAFDSK
ncbi:MAG: ABC transporter [Pontixanthobacter sp.]